MIKNLPQEALRQALPISGKTRILISNHGTPLSQTLYTYNDKGDPKTWASIMEMP
jgi:hypothetical protein